MLAAKNVQNKLELVHSRDSDLPSRLAREGNLLTQLASLTTPKSLHTTYLTHGIHPYPAKYIPQLPSLIIREHTNERNTVLDPFCGSGTTLLEAALLGRKSIGIDSNEVATLVASAKTTALNEEELDEISEFIEDYSALRPVSRFVAPKHAHDLNLAHWFQPNVLRELEALRLSISSVESEAPRTFLKCIFSSIIVSVSNQESETRYAAKVKNVKDGETIRRFFTRLARELPKIRELSEIRAVQRNRPKVVCQDIQTLGLTQIREKSVDLIVTSPPYPNSFDYYLYHKWRLFWIGASYRDALQAEIGSRNEHSSRKRPIGAYIAKMNEAMDSIARLLKPSKLGYFFIGDAVIGGNFYDISEVFREVLKDTDLRLVANTSYSLESVTRSFREKSSVNCHGGVRNPSKQQHVLVVERVNRIRLAVSSTTGRAAATPISSLPTIELNNADLLEGRTVAIKSREESRHVHSIGRYPSKFIPDLPRWAVTNFSRENEVVLDPFSGSGTTAVETLLAGRNAIACDISPYSCLLTRAKTARLEEFELKSLAGEFLANLKDGLTRFKRSARAFPMDTFWFPEAHLSELAACGNYIERAIPTAYQDFFRAVFSTVIRPCSYQDEGQIKVKRDPRKVLAGTPHPIGLLSAAIEKAILRKIEFLHALPSGVECTVFQTSADDLNSQKVVRGDTVDLIVTSPPYINAMNYSMTHRSETMVLGLIDPDAYTEHERAYFGSERVYSSDYSTLGVFSPTFSRAVELNIALSQIYRAEPKRSFIAFRFFSLMRLAINEMYRALKLGGVVVLVCGRNTIKSVPVDTVGFLTSMFEASGFQRELGFEYEIIKNAFKLTRHATADIIKTDSVIVLRKRARQ